MIKIGTSGWSYNHWFNKFYPQKINNKSALNYYESKFDTVEVNTSFYHLLTENIYERWQKKSNKDFLFSIKASRYITHILRLRNCEEAVNAFFGPIYKLKNNIGVILFQLPSNFKCNLATLKIFISYLPANFRYAFEFRNESWFNSEVYSLLEENNIALVFSYSDRFPHTEVSTTDFVYLRLHGSFINKGDYSELQLREIASKIVDYFFMRKNVFVYFNNDQNAFAPNNALRLKSLVWHKLLKAA